MNINLPRDIPTSFETERLILRCAQPGNGAEYFTAQQESFAELSPWFDLRQRVSAEACEALMLEWQKEFSAVECFYFLVFLKGGDKMVGVVNLAEAEWSIPSFGVGYWLRTPYTGQGLMTEAVRGLTRFAIRELGANRLVIYCNELNLRSAALARRAGYLYEGTLHNSWRHFETHELVNTCVFAFVPEMLIKEDL